MTSRPMTPRSNMSAAGKPDGPAVLAALLLADTERWGVIARSVGAQLD